MNMGKMFRGIGLGLAFVALTGFTADAQGSSSKQSEPKGSAAKSEQKASSKQGSDHKYDTAGVAAEGNCVVCLVKSDKVMQGNSAYTSKYDGKKYMFPGAKKKEMFDANPAAFTPAMRGNCVVCQVEMGKKVAGKAEHYVTYKSRLYLFPGEKQKEMFLDNPTKYADADLAMDGNCTVCKVEMNKDVVGDAKYPIDYHGKRYLFPGEKQLAMFKANPAKYAHAGEGSDSKHDHDKHDHDSHDESESKESKSNGSSSK